MVFFTLSIPSSAVKTHSVVSESRPGTGRPVDVVPVAHGPGKSWRKSNFLFSGILMARDCTFVLVFWACSCAGKAVFSLNSLQTCFRCVGGKHCRLTTWLQIRFTSKSDSLLQISVGRGSDDEDPAADSSVCADRFRGILSTGFGSSNLL